MIISFGIKDWKHPIPFSESSNGISIIRSRSAAFLTTVAPRYPAFSHEGQQKQSDQEGEQCVLLGKGMLRLG